MLTYHLSLCLSWWAGGWQGGLLLGGGPVLGMGSSRWGSAQSPICHRFRDAALPSPCLCAGPFYVSELREEDSEPWEVIVR